MAPINCRLESGDRFEFNIVPTGERFTAPFEVADNVTIPPGALPLQPLPPRGRAGGEAAVQRRRPRGGSANSTTAGSINTS